MNDSLEEGPLLSPDVGNRVAMERGESLRDSLASRYCGIASRPSFVTRYVTGYVTRYVTGYVTRYVTGYVMGYVTWYVTGYVTIYMSRLTLQVSYLVPR